MRLTTGRVVASVAVALLAALLALYLWYIGAFSPTRYEYWRIPLGFKGWIVAEYGRPDCPPIQRSADSLVYLIPSSGAFCTSDALPPGFAHVTFEYVLSNGSRVPILEDRARGRRTSAGADSRNVRALLFIGTAEEEEAALSTMPQEFR